MTFEIWAGIAFITSAVLNVVLVWFSREQSRNISYVSQNLGDLVEMLGNYKEHLRKIYSLEMFYGDETLEHLMAHTNAMISVLEEEYGNIVDITDPLEIIIEKEEENAEKEEQEQNVFYGGTRTSDS